MPSVNEIGSPILKSIAERWSPYRFSDRTVKDQDLRSCFEAARWAASSYNDQPWFWFVAKREHGSAFDQMHKCLLETNRTWAINSGVLILSVIRTTLEHNGKPNRVALHDLGQAAAHLSLQACSLGMQVHQIGGINLSVARQAFRIPSGYEPCTMAAIGYPETSTPTNEQEVKNDAKQKAGRRRKELDSFVFADAWNQPAEFVSK